MKSNHAAANPGDGEIVRLFFERDERAIAETKTKYGRLFRSIALRLLDNPSDAEECENETYWRLWNAIPPAKPDSLAAYGSKTVRNISLDRLARDRAEKRGGIRLATELSDALPDTRTSDFALVDLEQAIDAFLRKTGRRERVLFLLRYFHGYSIDELASVCDCSAEAVKSSLFRTRKALKSYLENGGYSL